MNKKTMMMVALGVAAVCGCTGEKGDLNVAFRAADAIVVTAADATAKSKQGAAWYRAALVDLTNAIAKVTGRVPAVFEETDYKSQIANCKAQEGKAQGKNSQPSTPNSQLSTFNSRLSTLSSRPVIYFGETEAAKAAGITGEGMRRGDWRIKTERGKAFLFATSGMAASYAMTDFCERYLDCHWYTPHSGLTATFNPDLTVPIVDLVMKPAIYAREVYHAMYNGNLYPNIKSKWENWCRRCQGAWTDELEGEYRLCYGPGPCHTIHNYLPPEKYFKDHPEWYSMTPAGERRGVSNSMSQICYSNREARDKVYERLVKFVEAEYKRDPKNPSLIFDMTQMDNADFMCLCPECKKIIAKYNRKEGGHREGGDAGLQLEFVNDLAWRIRVKYPKVQLRVFAYVSTECAPKAGSIKVEPNVMIWWCDVYGYSCHLYPLQTPGHFNAHQAEELTEWLAFTTNIQIWDYFLSGPPEIVADAAAADAKFFSEKRIPVMFMESEYSEQPFQFLNHYLLYELYADPTKDVDKLIHGFCRIYGKGAADMEAAVAFLRKLQNENKVNDKSKWHMRGLPWFTPANYEKLAAYCQAAYDKEPDPNARAHVLMVLKSAWKTLVGMYKKNPAAKKQFADAQEQYRRFGQEWAKYGFIEEKSRAKRAADVDDEIDVLTLRFDDLPGDLKSADPKEIICLDYHSFDSWLRNFKDEKAFRQRALPVAADRNACKKGFPFGGGVYDHISKDYFPFTVKAGDIPADGNYHWFKIGRMYLGRNTMLWIGEWDIHMPLSANHIYADGLPVDPNWYEMWASFRVDGPAFVKGSSEQNMIRLDRVAFKRIPPPPPKKK